MNVTAYDIAQRFVGIKEFPGEVDSPFIISMLTLDASWPQHDEVPWCSAFVNYVAWLLRLPRSKDLRARSWLRIGVPVTHLRDARPGYDVVVMNRADGIENALVIDAPGHVGFYAGWENGYIYILGGNQDDEVSVKPFRDTRLLGIRRLYSGVETLEKIDPRRPLSPETARVS